MGPFPEAVQAIRDGAFEFVTKPFDLDGVKKVVEAAVGSPAARQRAEGKVSAHEDPFLAISPAMRQVMDLVKQVAESPRDRDDRWGSGVGQESWRKPCHLSSRNKKPFIAVSCAAIPESRF